jgi:hypothetical protein
MDQGQAVAVRSRHTATYTQISDCHLGLLQATAVVAEENHKTIAAAAQSARNSLRQLADGLRPKQAALRNLLQRFDWTLSRTRGRTTG